MKKLVAVILVGVLAFAVVGCGGGKATEEKVAEPSAATAEEPKQEVTAEKSSDSGYALTKKETYDSLEFYVGEDWTTRTSSTSVTYYVSSSSFFMFVKQTELPVANSMDEFMENFKESFLKAANANEISNKTVKVAGKDTAQFEFDQPIDGDPYRTVVYVVFVDSKTAAPFIFICPVDKYESNKGLLDEFISKVTIATS